MKSFLSLGFVLLVFLTVVVVAGLLWYLSATSEFSRKDIHPAAAPAARPATPPTVPPTVPPARPPALTPIRP